MALSGYRIGNLYMMEAKNACMPHLKKITSSKTGVSETLKIIKAKLHSKKIL